jgi:predicted N-acyltransferase
VANFLEQERPQMLAEMAALTEQSPFRKDVELD